MEDSQGDRAWFHYEASHIGIGPTFSRQTKYWSDVNIQNQIPHIWYNGQTQSSIKLKWVLPKWKKWITRRYLPQHRSILLSNVAYNLLPTTIVIYSKWMLTLPFWMVAQWKKFMWRSPLVLSFQVHCGLQLAAHYNVLLTIISRFSLKMARWV